MKQNISLNSKELTTILINVLLVKLFFIFPKKLITNAGNAAWLQFLYLAIISVLAFFLLLACQKKCGTTNIIELSEKIGGNALKIFTGIFISIALFLNLASTMRSYPELVKMVLLPNTPIELILLFFSLTVAVSAFGGLEAIARIHAIFIPILLVILALFFVFLFPHMEIYNIFPIFGKGASKIFLTGLEGFDFFDDLIIYNLLISYARNFDEAKKSGIKGLLISIVAGFFILLSYCLVYPYPSSQNFIIPVYQLTRLVGIGDFFQRFEAFFLFVWSFSILLYSALYIRILCMVWRDCFNLKYEKPIIFPMMTVTTLLAFSAYSMQDIVFNYWYLSAFTIFMAIGLPIIFSLLYKRKLK